ncbi:primosomal protein N' [Methylicorpusculum sp.]|uniref:primosomal protein N' n=1 Tax=Methylicorpusculum sp. TaxID=2713644 RepID=UPI00272700C2|nr:primosomal protein N' [Methylicorpusculum sp.]MDO8844357.1 primosomal protein N' [Methylicorpusculum sp.]
MTNSYATEEPIFKIAVSVPLYRLFDYRAPENLESIDLKPGIRVEVPFGKALKVGVLVEIVWQTDRPLEKLKRIARIIDDVPLLSGLDLQLLHWAGNYYHHSIGEVIAAAFPVGLRNGKPAKSGQEKRYGLTSAGRNLEPSALKRAHKQRLLLEKFQASPNSLSESDLSETEGHWRLLLKSLLEKQLVFIDENSAPVDRAALLQAPELLPNPAQQSAIDAIRGALGEFRVFLLEGVTGSGKTEVYMQIIRSVLESGRQVLILLPEISLTPQLEHRFRQRFACPVAVTHSKLTNQQRQTAWLSMQTGKASILLGTRSALLTPLKSPGLIILDEEHDASFKQQEGFRFSARDIAVMRAKLLHVPVVLGSATPSLESYFNVAQQRYTLLHLSQRAGVAVAPACHLLDIRNKKLNGGLSEPLISEISATLARQEQVLIFLNRRGFAPTLICHACGWVARCKRCEANLVVHMDQRVLRCHHCGHEQPLHHQCPACKAVDVMPLGLGTERVEHVLPDLFPGKAIIRLDRDTTQRKGVWEQYIDKINRNQIDIIIGTQMLAKGHHFPNVTLVVLLDADSGLFSIDFRATERLAQLIVQVAGRAGRAEKPGKVILQTRHPEHPLLLTLLNEQYGNFVTATLNERRAAGLPPYSFQALLRVESNQPEQTTQFFESVAKIIHQTADKSLQVLGPVPAPLARKAGRYRYQLLFQSAQRKPLHRFLDTFLPALEKLASARKVRWSIDVDPIDLY